PCGCPLKDDFKELDSGALHNLRIFLQQEPSRPSECSPYVADSEADALEQESTNRPAADDNSGNATEQSSSSNLEGQNPGSVKEPGDTEARGYTPSLSTSSSDTILGDEEEPLAIYACFCFGSYGRAIKHLPVQRGWTDETLIASLAQAYYEKGNSWFTRYCSLWEVRSIRCIKFRLTDHELVDIEKFDHWPGEDHKLDWEYSPFPAPYTPLVSSVYIMHLWQNPLHMSRGAFQKQNTTLRRFLRPFRARGPNHPPETKSRVKKHLYLALSLFVKYRNAFMWLCKKAIPSAFLAPRTQRGGDATGSDVESTTSSPTTTCANTKDPESATTSTFQSRSAWFFNGTPKKLHHELQPCFDDDAHPPVGWALFFEEDLSAPPALFWLLTVHILGCLVSLIATGVQMPGLSVDAFFSIPALILAVSTFAYAMVSKNCFGGGPPSKWRDGVGVCG
ncbi:hypothetical protein MMC11_006265, partial [Xylographa trunciseda]|nr:hypothetical protein [Xylographa trunciseda]